MLNGEGLKLAKEVPGRPTYACWSKMSLTGWGLQHGVEKSLDSGRLCPLFFHQATLSSHLLFLSLLPSSHLFKRWL